MFGRLGTMELILLVVIVLVIFGPSKLPEMGKAVGKGIREFRSAASGPQGNIEDDESKANSDKE